MHVLDELGQDQEPGDIGNITVGEDGASHQMNEDLANMRVLPNMTVIVPSDGRRVLLVPEHEERRVDLNGIDRHRPVPGAIGGHGARIDGILAWVDTSVLLRRVALVRS